MSLPVLLSFNELAWIAVGAIVLVFVFFWREYIGLTSDTRVRVAQSEYEELKSRPVLGTTGMVVATDYLKNLRVLGPGEQAISASEWEKLHNPNVFKLSLDEYRDLTNRAWRDPSRTNVPIAAWKLLQGGLEGTMRVSNLLATSEQNLSNLVKQMQSEGRVRSELLNLKGSLTNVVILLDASASMNEKGRLQTPRWTEASGVIESWLRHLPIQHCALIVFSDSCRSTPPSGYLDMSNVTNRFQMIQQIRNLKPDGNTATVSALATTYWNYSDIDTIILFTDGKPYVPRANSGSPADGLGLSDASISREEIKRALELVRKHPNTPINVVALGDYFEKEQAEFLLKISRMSGGSFLGR